MKENVVMGFWHNWPSSSGQGYKNGKFKEMALTEIPTGYNVIAVAFMKVMDGSSDPIPDFKPYQGSDAEFRQQVAALQNQGRKVLISLGGADAHIEMNRGDELALAARIKELVSKFGFDGVDIDLEQSAITAADNQTVIPAALRMVKDYYHCQGREFIIGMAPEFPYLANGREYVAYIKALEGYYDYIAPQFYNQGGDGVWVEGPGWIAQDNDAQKEDFLYYLTESLVTGTRNFIKIPHDKFIIGLPTNNDAAASGYVINPQDVKNALARLEAAGLPIRGLMTWSVNWDAGSNSAGVPYNWEFIQRYGYLTNKNDNDNDNGNDVIPPFVPTVPEWVSGKRYRDNDQVSWNEKVWVCVMPHDANIFWTPEKATSLWNLG